MLRLIVSLALVCFCSFSNCLANPPFGGGGGTEENPQNDDDSDVPIDGGVTILAVAGAAYGVSRLKKKK